MKSDTITISKDELQKLIRKIVREEISKDKYLSHKEERELNILHEKSLYEENYDDKEKVRL